jgi:tetratricopeptide (TPR) repeat protein
MRDNIEPYSPCPCGSGKKYRFCCQRKKHDLPAQKTSPPGLVIFGDLEKGERLNNKGMECMAKGEYEKAISWFTKSLEEDSNIGSPANNLALCLFVTGKHEEAVRVQRKSLEESPLPNPFGYASLSIFLLFSGDEEGAAEAISHAITLEAPNSDATIKVCEALSHFKRHRDILETADASDFKNDPHVRFYTGVAAANLGDHERAIWDLNCVSAKHCKGGMAQKYLQHLKNKTEPNTIRKDWPYLLPEEYYINPKLFRKDKTLSTALLSRRYMVDFVEALLNDGPKEMADAAMPILELSSHPEATALLWLILKGTFGSDQLRMNAGIILVKKGEIQQDEAVKFLNRGEFTEQKLLSICLNSDFKFGELPPELEPSYRKLVIEGRKRSANWPKIVREYEKLIPQAPQYYPFRYNYAVGLVQCKRSKEAETILRSLVAEYPEYLFARSTLLTLLGSGGRFDEAKELVQTTEFPKETHPDAFVAWLVSLTMYFEDIEKNADAFKCIQHAQTIAPDDPNVKLVWKDWKDYDEEKDTSPYLMLKRLIKANIGSL